MTYNSFRGNLILRLFFIICFILTLSSCAKTPSEEAGTAVDLALTYLTDEKCDRAIDVLEAAGRTNSNPVYLQVLASAYACRAGYNEVNFLLNDVTKISGSALLTSLATLSLSPEHHADSDSYVDLRTALNVLLNSTTGQPSQAARNAKFGLRKAGDLGLQTLFLTLTQLGKFLHFYGNVDALGAKGKGLPNVDEQTSTESRCFIDYTNVQAEAFITLLAGYCTNATPGHPDLALTPSELTTTKKRMCEGLVLVTNTMDILSNLVLPANASLANINGVSASVTSLKSTAIALNPAIGTLLNTTSQADCESLVSSSTEFDNLQLIYAVLFEKGLP